MFRSSTKENGFTLVEVLVSVGIMLIFLFFAAPILINSQLLASYSKHKIQAAYAAQQILETQRQQPLSYFAPMLKTPNQTTTATGWVMLDTKGNYLNTTCTSGNIPCGTATITITPTVYTNGAGQKTQYTATYTPPAGQPYLYYITAHINVQVSWFEQIVNSKISMNENYAADIIVNDTMLN